MKSESFSADLEPTIHIVVQNLFSLDFDTEKTKLLMDDSVAKSFILSLKNNLKKRFPHFGTINKAYVVASILHPYYCGATLSMTQKFDDIFTEIIKKHQNYIDWQKNQQKQSQARYDEDEETHEEEDPLIRASKAYQQPTTTARENALQ